MINILFFFMYLVANITGHQIDSMQTIVKEDLDIERQLKLINKTPVKSIHVFHNLLICHYMILFVDLDLITWLNNFSFV